MTEKLRGGKQAQAVTRHNIKPERQGTNSIKFTTKAVQLPRDVAGQNRGPYIPGNTTYRNR